MVTMKGADGLGALACVQRDERLVSPAALVRIGHVYVMAERTQQVSPPPCSDSVSVLGCRYRRRNNKNGHRRAVRPQAGRQRAWCLQRERRSWRTGCPATSTCHQRTGRRQNRNNYPTGREGTSR